MRHLVGETTGTGTMGLGDTMTELDRDSIEWAKAETPITLSVVAEPRAVARRAAKPTPRSARPARHRPRREREARARVRASIRRFGEPLADLLERDANERDTRLLVTGFLREALGFDRDEDLTTDHRAADYGVRVDGRLVAFIEVKRCTQELNMRHLRQVRMSGVHEGVEWIILTNGRVWQVYHLTGVLPLIIDLALEVDLLSDASVAHQADVLFHLTKEALERHLLDDLWKAKAAAL